MKNEVLLFVGAIAGGAAGYFLFFWIVRQGFYGIILPGCLLGLGAGLFHPRSIVPCVVCGVLALALGLFTQWRFAPFSPDDSLSFFISHIHELRPITLLMIGIGGFIGFYSPFRSIQQPVQQRPEPG